MADERDSKRESEEASVLEGDYVEAEDAARQAEAAPGQPPSESPPKRRGRWIPWILVLAMAVFIGGLFAAPAIDRQLQRLGLPALLPTPESQSEPSSRPSGPESAALADTLEGVESRLAQLETAVNQLSQESSATAQGLSDLDQRVAALERAGPGQSGETAAALERLEEQVAQVSSRIDERVSALSDRLAALEEAQAETAGAVSPEEVANLTEAVKAASAERERLAGQVATLTRRLATLEAAGRGGQRQSSALLTRLLTLSRQLETGKAYADPLAAVRERVAALPETARVGAESAFNALAPHAESGIATRTALQQRFGEVAAAMQRSETQAQRKGWFERLRGSIASLVVVRPKEAEPDEESVAGAIARAETRLESGDLQAAVSALEQLPDPVRAPAGDWLADARARLEAERALRALMAIAGAPAAAEAADAAEPEASGGAEEGA